MSEEKQYFKAIISEPDFKITIYKWNKKTLHFLKNIIEENRNILESPEIKIGDGTKKLEETLSMFGVNPDLPDFKRELDPDAKQELSHKKINRNNIGKPETQKKDILAIYRDKQVIRKIEEYLEKNLPRYFTTNDILILLQKAYKEIFNNSLKHGSIRTYYTAYLQYMKDHNIIKKGEKRGLYTRIEKDPIEWTRSETDFLEKNFFIYQSTNGIDKAINDIAERLDKKPEDVRKKAKQKGMILK